MDIATGNPESHPAPLAYDPSLSPALSPVTGTVGQLPPGTVPARDTVAEAMAQMAGAEAECSAAQAAGMTAEADRRAHYAGVAAGYAGQDGGGDLMDLPQVPDAALPPAGLPDWYKPADEPIPGG